MREAEMRSHYSIRNYLFLAALLLSSPLHAASGFSFGAEYSEGDYGGDVTTRAWYLPLAWQYAGNDFRASLTIPYLSVEGSAELTYDGRRLAGRSDGGAGPGPGGSGSGGGGGATSTTTSVTETRRASGLGDILLSGGYRLRRESPASPWLAVVAKAKLGTADEAKGLGTGENDYALQLDGGKGGFSAYLGYRLLGDTPDVDYNDVGYAGVALDVPLSQWRGLTIKYSLEEASLAESDAVQKLGLAYNGIIGQGYGFSLFTTVGLSEGSADNTVGVTLSSPMQ